MKAQRYLILDGIRGFAILNMILYHAIWDLVYLFEFKWDWYHSYGSFLWQQGICWTFIFLSGFCQPFGHKKLQRAIYVLGAGFFISIVTWIFMPESRVQFGILTFLGSCMLLMYFFDKPLKAWNSKLGLLLSLFLFIMTRNVNHGFLGFGRWNVFPLPDSWYHNLITTYFGFPMIGFSSTDYFSFIPWCFLFLSGYFTQHIFVERNWLQYLKPQKVKLLEWIGQHSLSIYLLHQPIIYCVLNMIVYGFRIHKVI